jgi:hypothetical protein
MTKTNPFIKLEIFDEDDKLTDCIRTRKTRKIYNLIREKNFKNGLFKLRVVYSSDKGFVNEGYYNSKEYLIQAVKAFTQRKLVEEYT